MLLKEGLLNGKNSLDKELKHDIETRKKLERDLFVEIPRIMIFMGYIEVLSINII